MTGPHTGGIATQIQPEPMEASMSRQPKPPGRAGSVPAALGMGYAGGQRDAGWLPVAPGQVQEAQPGRSQLLHCWPLVADPRAASLAFRSLDGNPRHGVLTLFLGAGSELQGAIEILERQGRWLVMPDQRRARTLAVAALAGTAVLRGAMARTPDRRYVFFNTLQDGSVLTRVERRPDGDIAMT